MTGDVMRWADAAQYRSDEMPDDTRAEGGGTRPRVRLLNATPDPLGTLASICGIYEGRITRSLGEVTDDQRRAAWKAMQETVLNGPLEVIQLVFLVEGVTRAFTHQAVRNRFSFFAQESMRFAVVDNESWVDRQAYPPSLARKPEEVNPLDTKDEYGYGYSSPEERDYALKREDWDDAIINAQQAYQRLIDAGVPAEEARGLMPHSITTRYYWVVSVRTLLGEAGKRLCTQAQFEWRVVMAEVVQALRQYGARMDASKRVLGMRLPGMLPDTNDGWHFELMAEALQPVCYQEGKCGFMAKFDRGCTIRERVNANADQGRSSDKWHLPLQVCNNGLIRANDPTFPSGIRHKDHVDPIIPPIYPKEWLADPSAARTRPGGDHE